MRRERSELLPVQVSGRRSYIDTVVLTIFRFVPDSLVQQLYGTLAADPKNENKRFRMDRRTLENGHSVTQMTMQRPTPSTLDVLEAIQDGWVHDINDQREVFSVSRVDVALDIMVDSAVEALQLGRYVQSRLAPASLRTRAPWAWVGGKKVVGRSGKRPRTGIQEGATAYLNHSGHRNQKVVLYADRLSKLDGGSPCLHLEWRFFGAEAVRSGGLDSVEALRTLDYYDFWKQKIRLIRPATGFARSGLPYEVEAGLWIALATKQSEPFAVHDWLHRMGDQKKAIMQSRRAVTHIRSSWMLPSRENAEWEDIWFQLNGDRRRVGMISAVKPKRARLPLLGDAADWLY